jgi:hypothetical protein
MRDLLLALRRISGNRPAGARCAMRVSELRRGADLGESAAVRERRGVHSMRRAGRACLVGVALALAVAGCGGSSSNSGSASSTVAALAASDGTGQNLTSGVRRRELDCVIRRLISGGLIRARCTVR